MTATAAPVRLGRNHSAAWRRVTRGVHRPRGADSDLLGELAAWQSVLPASAAFTGVTGAAARGWWLPPLPEPTPVVIGMPHDVSRPRRPGLLVRRHCADALPETWGGLRVASAAETLLTAGRDLGLLDLVVVIDSALHAGACDLSTLAQQARTRRHGAPMLRRALPFVDARAESAWETVLRMLLRTCDVPVEPQYVVRDDDDHFLARADLWVRGSKRLMEYDGATIVSAAGMPRTWPGTVACSVPGGSASATPPRSSCTPQRRSCVRPTRHSAACTTRSGSARGTGCSSTPRSPPRADVGCQRAGEPQVSGHLVGTAGRSRRPSDPRPTTAPTSAAEPVSPGRAGGTRGCRWSRTGSGSPAAPGSTPRSGCGPTSAPSPRASLRSRRSAGSPRR